jgi:hypothetical protein
MMTKITLCWLMLIFYIQPSLFAQIHVEAENETTYHGIRYPNAIILPQKEILMVIIENQNQGYEYTFIKYDSLLNQVWQRAYPTDLRDHSFYFAFKQSFYSAFNYNRQLRLQPRVADNKLYQYIGKGREDNHHYVFSMDLTNGDTSTVRFKDILDKSFVVKDFYALPNTFLLVSSKNKTNTVLLYEHQSQVVKTLSNLNFYQANFPEINTNSIEGLLSIVYDNKKSAFFNLFDYEGNRLTSYKIDFKNKYHRFITYNTYIKNANEQCIIGLYGESVHQPYGIYVCKFAHNQFLSTQYYDFNSLPTEKISSQGQKHSQNEANDAKENIYKYSFLEEQYLTTLTNKVTYTVEALKGQKKASQKSQRLRLVYTFDLKGNFLDKNSFSYTNTKDISQGWLFNSWISFYMIETNDKNDTNQSSNKKLYFSIPSEHSKENKGEMLYFSQFSAKSWYDNYFLFVGSRLNNQNTILHLFKVK